MIDLCLKGGHVGKKAFTDGSNALRKESESRLASSSLIKRKRCLFVIKIPRSALLLSAYPLVQSP